jgi:hypothetical protein
MAELLADCRRSGMPWSDRAFTRFTRMALRDLASTVSLVQAGGE